MVKWGHYTSFAGYWNYPHDGGTRPGDGLLVYFGYPLAHEDDAQRAVRAGLGMIEAVGQRNTYLEREHGIRLTVRLGIHTGLVVVGDVGARSALR